MNSWLFIFKESWIISKGMPGRIRESFPEKIVAISYTRSPIEEKSVEVSLLITFYLSRINKATNIHNFRKMIVRVIFYDILVDFLKNQTQDVGFKFIPDAFLYKLPSKRILALSGSFLEFKTLQLQKILITQKITQHSSRSFTLSS